ASIAAPPAPAAPAEAPVAAAEPAAPAPPAPAAPAEVAQAPAPAAPAPEPAAPAPAAPEAPAEVAQAAPAPGGASTASYTAEQADRGEDAYTAECSGCHGTTLGGGGEAPGLLGAGFRNRLIPDGDAAALYAVIATTMPQQAPGTLSPETYADITAFLMERHQIAPGASEFAPPQ
ncbi:MAG: c-type cytochrome, partial [Bauldia sp.]|nr:c-type cytochrome [Bauldia sp.]